MEWVHLLLDLITTFQETLSKTNIINFFSRNCNNSYNMHEETSHDTQEQQQLTCSICSEAGSINFVRLHCGHCFHGDCIRMWARTCSRRKVIATCPLCRTNFYIVYSTHHTLNQAIFQKRLALTAGYGMGFLYLCGLCGLWEQLWSSGMDVLHILFYYFCVRLWELLVVPMITITCLFVLCF